MNFIVSKYKITYFLVFIFSIFFVLLFENSDLLGVLLSGTLLLTSLIFCFEMRKNNFLFLFSSILLYFNYSIVMKLYFIRDFPDYMTFISTENMNVSIFLLVISNLFFLCIGNFKSRVIPFDRYSTRGTKWYVYLPVIVLLLYIIIFAINRTPSINYEPQITPVYEYAYLLFIFGFHYGGKNKWCKLILYILALVYCLQDFYYGGRISTLQILIILYYYMNLKYNVKKVILTFILGIIVFNIIGVYRSNYTLVGFNLGTFLEKLLSNGFTLDTAWTAYYSGLTQIAAHDSFSISSRLLNFWGFIMNIIGINVSGYVDVTTLVRTKGFDNSGGTSIASYFYFWFKYYGSFLGITFISLIIRKINNSYSKGSELGKMFFIAMMGTFPRWYLYSPLAFFRGVIFFIMVMYFITIAVSQILNVNRDSIHNIKTTCK